MEKQATFDRTYKGDLKKIPYAGTFIHLRRLRPHQKPKNERELVTMTLTDHKGYPILPHTYSMGDLMVKEISDLYTAIFGGAL